MIKKNNNVINLNTYIRKTKIKKKFRHWRSFKFFFLRKKKKTNFVKLKLLFNYKRIIWHQLIKVYGKQIKNILYSKKKIKTIFNTNFFFFLRFLESRLNIIILRARFFSKLLLINNFISNNKIHVNKKNKKKTYLIKPKDWISCFSCFRFINQIPKFKLVKWHKHKWRKWNSNTNINSNNLFWLAK